jgi:hypothetical protein
MVRHIAAGPRSPFAVLEPGAGAAAHAPPPPSQRAPGIVARLALAPFAAVLAAVAGLLYVLLLPICGIASIASAVALASWSTLRDAVRGAHTRTAPRS